MPLLPERAKPGIYMNPLPPEDMAHLEAARGWIGLGDHTEAGEELLKIAPELHDHPDVLEVRWKIYASVQKWDESVTIADTLITQAPDRVSGWLTKSIALHGLNRIQEAYEMLVPVVDKFPHVSLVPYDLACYACRLGKLDEAKQWLERAFQAGDASRLRSMALADPDLEPIRASL